MKIAFDHQIFMLQAYGGISRYFVRLADELIEMDEDLRVVAPFYCNCYVGELPAENLVGRAIKKLPPKFSRLSAALNRHLGSRELKRFKPSILHETYYARKPVNVGGAKHILTVYDMIHEIFPDAFRDRGRTSLYKRAAVERADHIITISHSTKNDLCRILNIPQEKISVVHLGFEKFSATSGMTKKPIGDRPFLLFVGNRGGYKNFSGMLRAVASRRELCDTFDVVAFGGSAFNASEMRLVESCGLRAGSVHHFNGADDLLGSLYRSASALIYPSLYEGFGLPPLEAMAHGCPVVTSNTSSMPEVVGNAGEYFNPEDIDEQAQAICNVVFDTSRQKGLVVLGQERLGHFSWRKCAKETRDAYRRV